eukprot:TRINITY_DN4443_c0_g1_i1.p1 TRINITY_DN4443_c0_g1~~TRINITY_DN4443_c0_g1_i1.p1  ORF type:complete len:236 (-),score=39.66 TRINITY_DN4443_c0_g1_i1:199-861(-)
MTHVYAEYGGFPTDTPFVLHGTPAAGRWPQTIAELNRLIGNRSGVLYITLLMLIMFFITLAIVVGFMMMKGDPHMIVFVVFPVVFVFVAAMTGLMIFRISRIAKAIRAAEEYLRTENHSFYNPNGVNIHFVRGSKYQRTRLEIELGPNRSGGQNYPNSNMYQPMNNNMYNNNPTNPNTGSMYNVNPNQESKYNAPTQGSYFSGGQPTTGYSNYGGTNQMK